MLITKKQFAHEARLSIKIAMPLIASNLIQASSGFIGTIMIAHLGKDAIAAVAVGWAVYIALIVFFFGILNSISVYIAQNYGAKNCQNVAKAASHGVLLSIAISVPMLAVMLGTPFLLRAIEHNPHIVILAANYLHALIWCIVPLSLSIALEQIMVGLGKTQLVLWISIIQVPFEILATWLLIFGKLGLPKCGVAGIGYGFAIIFVLSAALIMLYLHKSPGYKKYHLFSYLNRFSRKWFFDLIKTGWPIGAMNIIEVAWFSVIAMLMSKIGNDQLVAYQITRQFWLMAMMIVFAMSQTTTVRIGHAVGEKNKDAIARSAFTNTIVSFAIILLIAICYIIFNRYLISIDINIADPKYQATVHFAEIFITLASIAMLIDNFRFIIVGALRGLKDTRMPMGISAVSFWVIALPLAYIFAFSIKFGGSGLWYAFLTGVILNTLFLLIRFMQLTKNISLDKVLEK